MIINDYEYAVDMMYFGYIYSTNEGICSSKDSSNIEDLNEPRCSHFKQEITRYPDTWWLHLRYSLFYTDIYYVDTEHFAHISSRHILL